MAQTPSNRPARPEHLAAALKRNILRRKQAAIQAESRATEDHTPNRPATIPPRAEGGNA